MTWRLNLQYVRARQPQQLGTKRAGPCMGEYQDVGAGKWWRLGLRRCLAGGCRPRNTERLNALRVLSHARNSAAQACWRLRHPKRRSAITGSGRIVLSRSKKSPLVQMVVVQQLCHGERRTNTYTQWTETFYEFKARFASNGIQYFARVLL